MKKYKTNKFNFVLSNYIFDKLPVQQCWLDERCYTKDQQNNPCNIIQKHHRYINYNIRPRYVTVNMSLLLKFLRHFLMSHDL